MDESAISIDRVIEPPERWFENRQRFLDYGLSFTRLGRTPLVFTKSAAKGLEDGVRIADLGKFENS